MDVPVEFILGTMVGALVSAINIYLFIGVMVLVVVMMFVVKGDWVGKFAIGMLIGALAGFIHAQVREVSMTNGWYYKVPIPA